MVVQNQSELGKGLAIPTDVHHTPTIIQSSTQPQKTQKPRKPKRKDTQVPQLSGPTNIVADEAVHKELGDSFVRAATTASSLKAEQDSGNITKTQSKATPNESSSLGTTSGGGPGCQDTMGDTIAQTRFANVSKLSNDSLLTRDEDITLVNDDADKEMFDVDTLNGEEVFVSGKNENVVEEIVDSAQVSTAATTVTITTEEITLAQALADLKSTKPKAKGIVLQDPGESTITTTISSQGKIAKAEEEKIDEANIAWDDIQAKVDADYQLAERLQAEEQEQFTIKEKSTLFKELLEQRRKHFAAKRAEEKRNKPPTKNFRTELVEGSSKRAGEELEQDNEEEVTIDVVPLATKSPSIVDWKIHKEGKKSYYQIVRADGKSQMYKVFSQMLKSFTREDLEDLYKLVKAKYGSTRPMEDLDFLLWNDLKTMFEPRVEDEI
ncbi:hypothetical protein Tco_1457469 [Tanacetum coccineum]